MKCILILLAVATATSLLTSCHVLDLARTPNLHRNRLIESKVVTYEGKKYVVRRFIVHTQPYETHTETVQVTE